MIDAWQSFLPMVDTPSAAAHVLQSAEKFFMGEGLRSPSKADGIRAQDLDFSVIDEPELEDFICRALRTVAELINSRIRFMPPPPSTMAHTEPDAKDAALEGIPFEEEATECRDAKEAALEGTPLQEEATVARDAKESALEGTALQEEATVGQDAKDAALTETPLQEEATEGLDAKDAALEGTLLQEEAKEGKYLVYNDEISAELRAARKGVIFFPAPSFETYTAEIELAPFGSIVLGVPCLGVWLKVGKRYLPMLVDGVPVLRPIEFEEAGSLYGRWIGAQCAESTELNLLFAPGTGSLYEVVYDKVLVRADPDTSSRPVGYRIKGQLVELFELDKTRAWGLCFDAKYQDLGWMLLVHPRFGELLRPINGMDMAVRQNSRPDLITRIREGRNVDERDFEGWSPLMRAAERDYVECCVLLLEARADPWGATDVANSKTTRALIQALGSIDCDTLHLEKAISLLPRHVKPLAVSLLKEAAKRPSPKARGDAFEVVHDRVWIRNKPHPFAAPLSSRDKGQVVELFEYDQSRRWRRTAMGPGEVSARRTDPKGSGWIHVQNDQAEFFLMPLAPPRTD